MPQSFTSPRTVVSSPTARISNAHHSLGARWRNPLLFVYGSSSVFFPYYECRQGNVEVVGGALDYTVNIGR
jgi:hypothetical protein